MGIIDDIMKALDRIPGWKRLQEIPSEVDALRKRVEELEQKLGEKWPADVCRKCGARAARVGHSHNEKGVICERYDCAECHATDFRYRKV